MPKEKNSFKLLEEEQELGYAENIKKVKNSVDGNLGGLSFITNIIDVYFARVVSYVVNMSGGAEDNASDNDGNISNRAK